MLLMPIPIRVSKSGKKLTTLRNGMLFVATFLLDLIICWIMFPLFSNNKENKEDKSVLNVIAAVPYKEKIFQVTRCTGKKESELALIVRSKPPGMTKLI